MQNEKTNSAMNDEVQSRIARRWQISICSLFVVVTATATILVLFQPEQPERSPPPIVPATETERIVLTIANQFARTRSTDFNVPIAIDKRTDTGTIAVIYWTPQRELELLGERTVIVNLELNTVEFAPRD
jgi:hypothetical protein